MNNSCRQSTLCRKKNIHFLFFFPKTPSKTIRFKKYFWYMTFQEIWHHLDHLYIVVALPWEVRKSHISTMLFVCASDCLGYHWIKRITTVTMQLSVSLHCISRNKRKRQPIGMLGRSSGNHDWLLANASAYVSHGFRLRNARKASDCVWMETRL